MSRVWMSNLFYGSAYHDGIKIQYFRTGGNKPSVVLAHGLCDNGLCWGRVAVFLEPEFDVIMMDARGHGLSNAPATGYDLETYAEDIFQVIRETGVSQPVVIGHSMGALAGLLLAKNNPDLVSSLILVEPPWLDIAEEEQRLRTIQLHNELKNQWKRFQGMSLQELIQEGQNLYPDWDPADLHLWAKARQQVRLQALDYLLEEPVSWRPVLKDVKIPILLLTGEPARGGLVTPQVADEAVRSMQRGYYVKIPGAGHQVYRDQIQFFLDAIQMALFHQNWDKKVKPRRDAFWPFSKRK